MGRVLIAAVSLSPALALADPPGLDLWSKNRPAPPRDPGDWARDRPDADRRGGDGFVVDGSNAIPGWQEA